MATLVVRDMQTRRGTPLTATETAGTRFGSVSFFPMNSPLPNPTDLNFLRTTSEVAGAAADRAIRQSEATAIVRNVD